MNERAVSHRFPFVAVQIQVNGPLRRLDIAAEALIDSGFDGDLIIPVSHVEHLGQSLHRIPWTLADGSMVEGYSYSARASVTGLSEVRRVSVTALGDELLVGLRLSAATESLWITDARSS